MEQYVRACGVKKGFLVESALLHHLKALEELPADVIIPPRLMVCRESGEAVLEQLKRIELPDEPQRFVPEALHTLSVTPLPIGVNQAIAATTLPLIHRDPFDRIIIAEAVMRKMTVLTRDERLAEYGVQILW